VTIVETAIVASLFFMLLWGIVSFGYSYMLHDSLVHATQEGLRAAQSVSLVNPPPTIPPPGSRCAYYNGGTLAGPVPSDPRSYFGVCAAYDRITHTTLKPAQGATGIVITVNEVGGLIPLCGAAEPDPQARCLSIRVLFHNDSSNSNNPVPPALPGISAFVPSTISATATAKV